MKFLLLIVLILATQWGWRWSREYTYQLSEQERVTAARLKDTVVHLTERIGQRYRGV